MNMRQAEQVAQMASDLFGPVFSRSAIFSFEEQPRSLVIEPPELGLRSQRFDIVGILEVHSNDWKRINIGHDTSSIIVSDDSMHDTLLGSFGWRGNGNTETRRAQRAGKDRNSVFCRSMALYMSSAGWPGGICGPCPMAYPSSPIQVTATFSTVDSLRFMAQED
jgi:hypothetical protein